MEEETPNPVLSFIKKLFLFIIGIFILYLMFSLLGGGALLSYIQSMIESETIDASLTIMLENKTTIVFSQEAYIELFDLYLKNQEHEFMVCLRGMYEEAQTQKTYTITALTIPETYSQSVHQVISAGCDGETLIALHTHPYEHCIFSSQDIASFFAFHKRSPYGLFALMCTENKFTFYGY